MYGTLSNRARRVKAHDEGIKVSRKHRFQVIATHKFERHNKVPGTFSTRPMTKNGHFHMENAGLKIFSVLFRHRICMPLRDGYDPETTKILNKKTILRQPLGGGRMPRTKFSVPFTGYRLSYSLLLC